MSRRLLTSEMRMRSSGALPPLLPAGLPPSLAVLGAAAAAPGPLSVMAASIGAPRLHVTIDRAVRFSAAPTVGCRLTPPQGHCPGGRCSAAAQPDLTTKSSCCPNCVRKGANASRGDVPPMIGLRFQPAHSKAIGHFVADHAASLSYKRNPKINNHVHNAYCFPPIASCTHGRRNRFARTRSNSFETSIRYVARNT